MNFDTIQLQTFSASAEGSAVLPSQSPRPDLQAIKVFQQVYDRPTELPPATPETLAKVVAENVTLAKELPQSVSVPQPVGDDLRASRPVESRPIELPPATPETLTKVVAENATLAKELPPSVSVPQPVGDDPRASRPVESRPIELPPATPETLAKVVTENVTLAKELPQPVELPQSVELPRPVELPPATSETLAKVVTENMALAKKLPQPVQLPRASKTEPTQELSSSEDVVLQAAPETVGVASSVTSGVGAQDDISTSGVAAKVVTEVPRTAGDIVFEAVSAVADALLVTPSLMRGEGEITVQLKPDVLDGSQVHIQVQGSEMKIEFRPVTETVARLLTETHPQLAQHLTARIPAFEFAVTVLPANVTGRQFARRGDKATGGEI